MVILLVDDDAAQRDLLRLALEKTHECFEASDGSAAMAFLESKAVDLVITDIQMPKMTGIELLKQARAKYSGTEFLVMTSHASVTGAVEAIRAGARDYLMKPIDLDELDRRVGEVARGFARDARSTAEGAQTGAGRLVGPSPMMKEARQFVAQAAGVGSTVLLLGPTGTGKEVMARAIHEAGPRSSAAFVAVNCASLSDQLLESELFGHEKGAFTGAVSAKPGLFELAKGGTVFLDEIGEMPTALQARLLRVLQEKEFYRVGGTRIIRTDARVIAATHRDLAEQVRTGKFREDLYFRMNVLRFKLTALRERPADIEALFDFFWNKYSREFFPGATLTPSARQLFLNYRYPGNVRELINTIERTLVLANTAPSNVLIDIDRLPAEMKPGAGPPSIAVVAMPAPHEALGLNEQLDALETRLVSEAMARHNGNQVQAARALGITRGALQYKLKRLETFQKKGEAA